MQINQKYMKYLSLTMFVLNIIAFVIVLIFVMLSINGTIKGNKNIFAYSLKVNAAVEEVDKILERAELNTKVLSDSIYNNYDIINEHNKAYNLQFVNSLDGMVKAVLINTPGVDGSWFQLNADLPYATQAYSWYSFKNKQFINVKSQLDKTNSANRKITPENDPYYFNSLNSTEPTWSDIYTDPDTRKNMITVSNPIYKGSNKFLIGVVGVDISIDDLEQALINMQAILGHSELFLLNKKNDVILFRVDDASKPDGINYPFLKQLDSLKIRPIEYEDNSIKKTAIMVPLSNQYKIVIAIDNITINTQNNYFEIISSIIALILAFLAGWLISTKLASIKK